MSLAHAADYRSIAEPDVVPEWPERVLNAVNSLLCDPTFRTSERNKRFLRFIVEETLAGRGDRIKSYSIAVDVFGRSASFDAAADPIVRIEATRLRAALAAYYDGPGKSARIRMSIPRGGYVPAFEELPRAEAIVTAHPSTTGREKASVSAEKPLAPVAAAGFSILLIALLAFGLFGITSSKKPPALLVEDTSSLTAGAVAAESARGLNQALVLSLARIEGLRVIPVESIGERALVARRDRGPTYGLASSLRFDGPSVHVWWSLSDTKSGEILSSGDTSLPTGQTSPLVLESELATRIADHTGATTGIAAAE